MRVSRRYRKPGAHALRLGAQRSFRLLLVPVLLLLAGGPRAHASVTLLLEEPYGGMGSMNPTGHSAIYLDHICAATPLSLRPCRPGELGVVISRYDGITRHDWVAVPLVPYLYSVESASDIPVTVNRADVFRMRDAYRRTHLQDVAPDTDGGKAPDGNWYELVGSAFDRSIFGFQLKSTPEQDASLMALLNDRKNSELYNGMFRNCADFARVTLNRFYPHMVRRNFIADLGMTTPKSVARALSHYAAKHPETELQTWTVAQLSGDLPRSQAPQCATEGLIKEYGLPLVALSPVTTAVVLVAYVGHGRFAEPKRAPVLNLRPGLTMEGAISWSAAPGSATGTVVAASSANAAPRISPAPPPAMAIPAKAATSGTARATLVRGTLE
jgi:hypothetical protein